MDKPSLLNAIEALKTATGVNSVTPEVLASIYENIILILEENIDGKYSEFSSLKSSFNNFLSSADTSNSTINRWKEIEAFLQGITDTDTLIGLLEELHSRMTSELESVEDFLVSNFTLKSELVEGISQSRKEESQIKALVETEKERITQEIEERQNIIREIQPKLLKGYLYVKNMDSTNTNFRLFTDSSKTTEFISNYVGGEVGSLWRVSGDVAGLLISGWHHLTLICSNYILRFYYTDDNGEVLPTTSTSGGYWRKTIRLTYHTYEEQSSWNKVVKDFNSFISEVGSADAILSKWKEIDAFLQGITDTESLSGMLESLRTSLQKNIDVEKERISKEEISRISADESILNSFNAAFSEFSHNTEDQFSSLERQLQEETTRAQNKEQTLSERIGDLKIQSLQDISAADKFSYLYPSGLYVIIDGSILIYSTTGLSIGMAKQTLIKEGEVSFRYNIKKLDASPDSSYWSEWAMKSSPIIIPWSETFNLNDYKTQGIYYITGERLQSENDNLPIMNASSGHTISGQLTVLDASLSDAERCVTQYLKLTNRTGSEGKEYIRTYNKYSNGNEGWSVWKELKQTANLNQKSDVELKNYTENGLYEGAIFNGSYDIQDINTTITSFISASKSPDGARELPSVSLFTMEVLNNYAVVQKAEQMGLSVPSSIVQRARVLLIGGSYYEVYRIYFNVDDNGPRSYWSNWWVIGK